MVPNTIRDLGVGLSLVGMEESSPFHILDFLVTHFDPHGDQHAGHVTEHASQLAKAAGLDAQDVERIEIAARYHDVGKIFIPESIRRFPGLFTPLEHHVMRKHCEVGAQLLQLFDFHPDIIACVLDHQENFDGSGYPMGLRGEMIPIGARIIRIVDTFDAMTNSRGYRHASPQKRALEKMQKDQQQYDPELLQLFSQLIRMTWTRQA
jgi:putative nucleotidyltransferase with HDIG domain